MIPCRRDKLPLQYSWASLVVQLVKNPPATWETSVWSMGWLDPLEKGKVTTHLSILAWRIPWTNSLWGHPVWVTEWLSLFRIHFTFKCFIFEIWLLITNCKRPKPLSRDLRQFLLALCYRTDVPASVLHKRYPHCWYLFPNPFPIYGICANWGSPFQPWGRNRGTEVTYLLLGHTCPPHKIITRHIHKLVLQKWNRFTLTLLHVREKPAIRSDLKA